MSALSTRRRRRVGALAFLLGLAFVLWLPLGVLGWVPFVFSLSGESSLRVHGAAAVLCLLVAAWGYWEQ